MSFPNRFRANNCTDRNFPCPACTYVVVKAGQAVTLVLVLSAANRCRRIRLVEVHNAQTTEAVPLLLVLSAANRCRRVRLVEVHNAQTTEAVPLVRRIGVTLTKISDCRCWTLSRR
jgi:D-aminopeptidase